MARLVVLLFGPAGAGKTTAARSSGLTVFDRDDEKWSGERQFTQALRRLALDPSARAVVIRSGATSSARTVSIVSSPFCEPSMQKSPPTGRAGTRPTWRSWRAGT